MSRRGHQVVIVRPATVAVSYCLKFLLSDLFPGFRDELLVVNLLLEFSGDFLHLSPRFQLWGRKVISIAAVDPDLEKFCSSQWHSKP